jgi:hypothetical protein
VNGCDPPGLVFSPNGCAPTGLSCDRTDENHLLKMLLQEVTGAWPHQLMQKDPVSARAPPARFPPVPSARLRSANFHRATTSASGEAFRAPRTLADINEETEAGISHQPCQCPERGPLETTPLALLAHVALRSYVPNKGANNPRDRVKCSGAIGDADLGEQSL